MKFVDTHAHYIHRKYNSDRDFLLNDMLKYDLAKIIECGTDTKSNRLVEKLTRKYDNIYGVVGYFPTSVSELENEQTMSEFKYLLEHKKIIGVGEIGLDYYHDKTKDASGLQAKWFREQLEIAKEFGLPVCIHSRDAEVDTMKILREFGPYKGVIHCYAYGPENIKELVELGYYFGVGGTSTYLNNTDLRDAIKQMPLNRILLETDAPYLSPRQVRRERNNSSYIKYVITEISQLKGVSEDIIIKRTNQNVTDLYGIELN